MLTLCASSFWIIENSMLAFLFTTNEDVKLPELTKNIENLNLPKILE